MNNSQKTSNSKIIFCDWLIGIGVALFLISIIPLVVTATSNNQSADVPFAGMLMFGILFILGGKKMKDEFFKEDALKKAKENASQASNSRAKDSSDVTIDALNARLYWDREGQSYYGRKLSTQEIRERNNEAWEHRNDPPDWLKSGRD